MGSQVRSTIIGVLAGFASVIIRNTVVPPNISGITNIAIYTMFAVFAVLIVVMLQVTGTHLYQKYPTFRRIFDTQVLRQSFFEGFWVDVGVNDPGIHPQQIVNCSFITIIRTDDVYTLEGISWNVPGGDWWTWRSYWAKLGDRKLTFWYQATQAISRKKIDAKAEIQYMDLGANEPAMYEGRYDNDYFYTVAQRLPGKKFMMTRAMTFNEKHDKAHEFLKEYKDRENFDDEYRRIHGRGIRKDMDQYRQWYITFLRYSENKTEEIEILQKSIGVLSTRTFNTILDVGPGEGSVTAAFLETLKTRGLLRQLKRYVGLEPSGNYLHELSVRLQPVLGSSGDFRLTNIEDFLSNNNKESVDSILACNSLYFVEDLKKVCHGLIELLTVHGVLIALHTDFARERDRFLSDLIASVNDKVNRDVVETLRKLVDDRVFSVLGNESGNVRIEFPAIDNEYWRAIESGSVLPDDQRIQDAVNLVCFLVNRDAKELKKSGQWADVVRRVSNRLEANRNRIDLPIQLQVLEKA